jgi:hypothetical protein
MLLTFIQWPWALPLAIVLPIVTAWLVRWGVRARTRRLARLGTPSMIARLAPSLTPHRAWTRVLRAALATSVWHTGCTSWYVDENGNDPNQWPWLWSAYRKRAETIEPGVYELSA